MSGRGIQKAVLPQAEISLLAAPSQDGSRQCAVDRIRALSLAQDYERPSAWDALPQSKDHQIRRHRQSVNLLLQMISVGAKAQDDVVWRNTCQWFLGVDKVAGSGCKIGLHVLLTRHDSADLVADWKKNHKSDARDNLRAYFGASWAVPFRGDDARDAPQGETAHGSEMCTRFEAYPDCYIGEADLQAQYVAEGQKILIVDPMSYSPQELKAIIKHQVQGAVAYAEGAGKGPRDDKEFYQAEFTKHWIRHFPAGTSRGPGPADPIPLGDGRELRGLRHNQAIVVKEIWADHQRVRTAWNATFGSDFQKFLVRMEIPRGKNLINSPRIDNLYRALHADSLDLGAVTGAYNALDSDDRTAISSEGSVAAWRDEIEAAKLPRAQEAQLMRSLKLRHNDKM